MNQRFHADARSRIELLSDSTEVITEKVVALLDFATHHALLSMGGGERSTTAIAEGRKVSGFYAVANVKEEIIPNIKHAHQHRAS